MRKNKKDLKKKIDPDERQNRHRRKVDKKPYKIEFRRVDDGKPRSKWWSDFYGEDLWKWHDYWVRYETKRARDQALQNLQKKMNQPKIYGWKYEFRIPLDETGRRS